jgi:hypothetical protein
MKRGRVLLLIPLFLAALAVSDAGSAYGRSEAFKGNIYETGKLKPVDSVLRVTWENRRPICPSRDLGGAGNPFTVRGKKTRGDFIRPRRVDARLLGSVAGVRHSRRSFQRA